VSRITISILLLGIFLPTGSIVADDPPRGRDLYSCTEILEDALKRRSIEELAGKYCDMLRTAKTDELVAAAREGRLTIETVAAFAQSVHRACLSNIEQELNFPRGFFRAAMRQTQFGETYKFIGTPPASEEETQVLQAEILAKYTEWLEEYRGQGGRAMPLFPMQLAGMAHGMAAASEADESEVLRQFVARIPAWELKRRHDYILTLPTSEVPGMESDRPDLKSILLQNMDHLLASLGRVHEGKLLVAVYAENVPTADSPIGYVPIHAIGEGSYCVDDVARVVVALAQSYAIDSDQATLASCAAGAKFLLAMQAEDGEFYNFASLDDEGRFTINTEGRTSRKGIGFWSARAVWGLAAAYGPLSAENKEIAARIKTQLDLAIACHESTLERFGEYVEKDGMRLPCWLLGGAADQTAILLKGLLAYHRSLPAGSEDQKRIAFMIDKYAQGLVASQVTNPDAPDYGRFIHSIGGPRDLHLWGSQQMEAVAEAGDVLGNASFIAAAQRCADNYWRGKKPADLLAKGEAEIAYGIGSVTVGFAALYNATGTKIYAEEAEAWASWFFGDNGASAVMYDPFSGRCYDGINSVQTPRGIRYSVSVNSGAESTVEAILALQAVEQIPGIHKRLKELASQMLPK